jgi:prephenate dehydrogenase
MTFGLIGYGRFGRFAARHLSGHGKVVVYDPSARRIRSPKRSIVSGTLSEAASQPVVILALPVSEMRAVLVRIRKIVRPGSLVLDVCAVKEQPTRWMRDILPRSVHILGTHPLFGPDSAAQSICGHHVALCPVRMSRLELRIVRRKLRLAGLVPHVMTAQRHDWMMAETILLTQFVGRVVLRASLRSWPAYTRNYRNLLELVDVTRHDTRQLFTDMVRFNRHGRAVARSLGRAVREELASLESGHD